jgi:alpha-beta hydrolase superfamily lysophospholipase
MPQPFDTLPRFLAERSRLVRLGEVPALLAHPGWGQDPTEFSGPRPFLLWMHGRTANKELDPGRYMRCLRAGIAVCAVDLPGHGERSDQAITGPEHTVEVVSRMVAEIDLIVAALKRFGEFDTSRIAIGGMSAGGMSALRRLCDPHTFVAGAVECTTGWLNWLYFQDVRLAAGDGDALPARWIASHSREAVNGIDSVEHIHTFAPIPMLFLHPETDRVVPYRGLERFVELLRTRYRFLGADDDLLEVRTWRDTGAPEEHSGFGKYGNDAKNAQLEFLVRHLKP